MRTSVTPVGVVAKYNPCSTYARLGKECPRAAERKSCALDFGPCSDKEYDLWFKRVVKGRIKYFFPKRIRLLKTPGTVLVIYHCKKRALVGEAIITKATSEKGIYKYFFERFLLYPKEVALSKEGLHRRFQKIPARGRWWLVYIDDETLEEIRAVSDLQTSTRDKLKEDLKDVRARVAESCHSVTRQGFDVEEELGRLIALGTDEAVLRCTKEIFSKIKKTKAFPGRSLKTLFYASFYLACRNLGKIVRIKDISRNADMGLKGLATAVKLVRIEFDIALPRIHLKSWVRHYSALLRLSKETTQAAITVAMEASRNNRLKNRSPCVLSGAAIYVACLKTHVPKKQKEISKALNVSTISLWNLSKILSEM